MDLVRVYGVLRNKDNYGNSHIVLNHDESTSNWNNQIRTACDRYRQCTDSHNIPGIEATFAHWHIESVPYHRASMELLPISTERIIDEITCEKCKEHIEAIQAASKNTVHVLDLDTTSIMVHAASINFIQLKTSKSPDGRTTQLRLTIRSARRDITAVARNTEHKKRMRKFYHDLLNDFKQRHPFNISINTIRAA